MGKGEEQLEQAQAINALLLDMVRDQKDNTRSIIRVFVITIACYTLLLITLIIGFIVYEGQFEIYKQTVETISVQEVLDKSAERIEDVGTCATHCNTE